MTTTTKTPLPMIEALADGGVVATHDEELQTAFRVVCAELLELRATVDQLRASLAKEIRTERLVVVHPDDGRELVHTERLPGSIALKVNWLPEGVETHGSVDLVSAEEGGGSYSTVSVSACEEIVGMLSAHASDQEYNLRADGSMWVGETQWGRKRGETVERSADESDSIDISPGCGITLHRDGTPVGAAKFEVKF